MDGRLGVNPGDSRGPTFLDNHAMDTRWKPNVTVAAIIERDGRYLLVEEHTQEGLRLNLSLIHI